VVGGWVLLGVGGGFFVGGGGGGGSYQSGMPILGWGLFCLGRNYEVGEPRIGVSIARPGMSEREGGGKIHQKTGSKLLQKFAPLGNCGKG